MALDVTDLTFETEVLARSDERPIVIDLWAPWCGPCRTLGPILEKVIDATEGSVELVKVNVDENPQISAAFQVQSIPAVFAVKERKIIDSFIGALPEPQVREFVDRLAPGPSEADLLVAAGDEESLRQALEIDPGHEAAIVTLAELLVESDRSDEALALLTRIPESADTRRIAALARLRAGDGAIDALDVESIEARLTELLPLAKDDPAARQEYIDLLEAMNPEDSRREQHRRALAARLF